MPITERLVLDVHGEVADWSPAVKVLLQTLKAQPGYVRSRWGPQTENMKKLEFLIGWENQAAQDAFIKSPEFGPLMAQLKPILTNPPNYYNVVFTPHAPQQVIDSKFVELVTIADASGKSEDELRAYGKKASSMEGCNGATGGFEQVDGANGKRFVAVVGWETMEASHKAKAEAGNDLSALGGAESHHVNFRFPVKGFRGL